MEGRGGADRRLARLAGSLLVALSTLLLGACNSSLNPIGPRERAVPVPELLGSWIAEECGSQTRVPAVSQYLHILPLQGLGAKELQILYVITSSAPAVDEQQSWMALDGYVIALPNGRFVNLRLVGEGAGAATAEALNQLEAYPYFFAPYKLSPDHKKLFVSFMGGYGALGEGARSGRLKNACTAGSNDVCITDSSASLAGYLGSLDEETLFKGQCVFRKLD